MPGSYHSDATASISPPENPDTILHADAAQNAKKHTVFSKLPISVSQVLQRCSSSDPQEAHMSRVVTLDARALVSLIHRAALLEQETHQGKTKKQKALAHRIYSELLPRLIRLLRGSGYEGMSADHIEIMEIFDRWFQLVRDNADDAGYDTDAGMPCSDEVIGRMSEMWQTAYAREHDWLALTQSLISCRHEYVTAGTGRYPETLRKLEDDLVHRQIGMRETDAAGVLVCWTISATNPDGTFFLAERDAGQLVCSIAGKRLEDMEHARIVGRTMLRKLVRLGIISVVAKGVAWTKTSRDGKATKYRWSWPGDTSAVSPGTTQEEA